MTKGDRVLYYHSNRGLQIVGVDSVTREYYPDPTTEDERWVVVDLEPLQALKNPVTLSEIKTDGGLKDIPLVQQSRLSVMPVTKQEYEASLKKEM